VRTVELKLCPSMGRHPLPRYQRGRSALLGRLVVPTLTCNQVFRVQWPFAKSTKLSRGFAQARNVTVLEIQAFDLSCNAFWERVLQCEVKANSGGFCLDAETYCITSIGLTWNASAVLRNEAKRPTVDGGTSSRVVVTAMTVKNGLGDRKFKNTLRRKGHMHTVNSRTVRWKYLEIDG
jgi:hypothetical protein